jgi:predicted transcriptional regulator
MTPAQCRAARALLCLPRPELAKLAVVPANLIADYEAGAWVPRAEDLAAIQRALEAAGVVFIPDGVKLRPQPPESDWQG